MQKSRGLIQSSRILSGCHLETQWYRGRGYEPTNAGSLKKLGEARPWILPGVSRKGPSPTNTLVVIPVRPILYSQNC